MVRTRSSVVPECAHVMVGHLWERTGGGSWGNRTSYCLCVCVLKVRC